MRMVLRRPAHRHYALELLAQQLDVDLHDVRVAAGRSPRPSRAEFGSTCSAWLKLVEQFELQAGGVTGALAAQNGVACRLPAIGSA